jgi:hypothetical protein
MESQVFKFLSINNHHLFSKQSSHKEPRFPTGLFHFSVHYSDQAELDNIGEVNITRVSL